MSKNTASNRFRKVDVDQYDEDKFKDEEQSDDVGQGPAESEVNNLLAQSKSVDALKVVLQSAPHGSKNPSVKERAATLVLRVLQSFKVNEIEKAISSLDQPTVDVLMKYIYKGFEFPTEGASANLLTWHEKAFERGGHGTIVRVLTDRKTV